MTGYIATLKLAGVPIYIHWSFPAGGLVIVAFLGDYSLITGLSAVAAYTALVVAHELGHAYFAKRAGMTVHALAITAGGGLCFSDRPPAVLDRLLLYSGGLLVQVAIFLLAVSYLGIFGNSSSAIVSCFLAVFTLANAVIFLGNLIPYRGNDGSLILQAIRELRGEV